MAYDQRSLEDYIDVAQRIADFRQKYPHGTLQPANPAKPWEQAIITGYRKDGTETTQTFIVYTAAAYRTPDDPRPGIGQAWEIWPGRTPYTLGSELMNAETSAWGRAIIAVGASDSKAGIASRQEVRNRSAERDDGLPVNRDGTLSRSRTTDAEKDCAGVMTAEQLAEHTALQAKRGESRPAARGLLPPGEDPWDIPPEVRPGSIRPRQRSQMHAAFAKIGVNDRGKRLALTAEVVGREVASSNDLSSVEADRLLRDLLHRAAEKAEK